MAHFIINTTGTLDPVVFSDLGYRAFYTATTLNYNLTSEFTLTQITNSKSVQSAIDNGYITAKDEHNNIIYNSNRVDSVKLSAGTNVNIFGSDFNPVVSVNNNTLFNSVSANTISGGTIYSGNTNLYSIFQQIGVGGDGSSTSVQPGSNITTGGTASAPTINVIDSPSINSLTTSGLTTIKSNFFVTGNTTVNTLTANTLSATTYLGNGGNLTGITGAFGITIDGNGNVLTTGQKGFFIVPYNLGITGWDIVANTSGNCAIDIWKNTTFPTVSDSITGTQKPMLNNIQFQSNTGSLNTWITGVTNGEIIVFNLISATTISKLTLSVRTIKN